MNNILYVIYDVMCVWGARWREGRVYERACMSAYRMQCVKHSLLLDTVVIRVILVIRNGNSFPLVRLLFRISETS